MAFAMWSASSWWRWCLWLFIGFFMCMCVVVIALSPVESFFFIGMVGWTTREDRCAFGRVYISPLLLLVYHRVGVFHVLRKFCAEKTGNCKTAINQQEHNIGARDPPSTFLQKRKMFHLWTGLTTDALIGLQPIVQSFCRTKSIEAFSDENSDLRISLVIVPHTKWAVWKARADLLVDCCDCHWISCIPVFMILLNWEELCVQQLYESCPCLAKGMTSRRVYTNNVIWQRSVRVWSD